MHRTLRAFHTIPQFDGEDSPHPRLPTESGYSGDLVYAFGIGGEVAAEIQFIGGRLKHALALDGQSVL
jgi:hypothetical protein